MWSQTISGRSYPCRLRLRGCELMGQGGYLVANKGVLLLCCLSFLIGLVCHCTRISSKVPRDNGNVTLFLIDRHGHTTRLVCTTWESNKNHNQQRHLPQTHTMGLLSKKFEAGVTCCLSSYCYIHLQVRKKYLYLFPLAGNVNKKKEKKLPSRPLFLCK